MNTYIKPPDPYAQYQSDLVNYILGDPFLALIPVYKFKAMVIADVAQQAIAFWQSRGDPALVGLAIEVRMPAFRAKYPNVPGSQSAVEMCIRVKEDSVVNNTGITCESASKRLLAWCDGLQIDTPFPGSKVELIADTSRLNPAPNYEDPSVFAYDVFLVSEHPEIAIPRCATPTIEDDGNGNITIVPGADNAPVFYSQDGSMPVIPSLPDGTLGSPALTGATQLYIAPFLMATAPACFIRAIAWQPGFLPSFPDSVTVTLNNQ